MEGSNPLARIDEDHGLATFETELEQEVESSATTAHLRCTPLSYDGRECYVTLTCIRERLPVPSRPTHIWP